MERNKDPMYLGGLKVGKWRRKRSKVLRWSGEAWGPGRTWSLRKGWNSGWLQGGVSLSQ